MDDQADKTKPPAGRGRTRRSRRFQFSLAALLICVTCVAIVLGIYRWWSPWDPSLWLVTGKVELGNAICGDDGEEWEEWYFGIELVRGDQKILLWYGFPNDNMPLPGDRIRILSDLSKVEPSYPGSFEADPGCYHIEDVEYRIVRPGPRLFR